MANFFARYSVKKYNSCRPLRVICRKIYQGMVSLDARLTPPERKLGYPWPYCDPGFPGFPEDEDALVTDPAGFVVQRSTSYVAWRIKCLTGEWPRQRAYKGKRYDAKDWGEFLELNGFRDLKGGQPWVGYKIPFRDAYVGINREMGEFGQVFWLMSMGRAGFYGQWASKGEHADNEIGYVCATYCDFKPTVCWIAQNDPDVAWYAYVWDHF